MFGSMFTSLRAARVATFSYFALNGFVLGIWVVHIPAVEQRAGISHATLGWLLLLLGGGAFAGMQITGPLTDRFGARLVVPVSGVFLSAALVLPALATEAWALGAALLVLGLGNGCLDVSMNAHAVQVEAAYRRPVMSAFHAMFSIGGVLASVLSARTLSWGWGPATTLSLVAVAGVVVAVVSFPGLLARPQNAPAEEEPAERKRRPVPLQIWVLAALALMLMLSEGAAADWSALAMRDVLGASPATAALAYGAFATAMTAGRFVIDRVAARVGPVAVLRWGAALAALALVLVVWSPSIPVALAGWTLFGAGLAGTIPQLFSAAGHSDPAAAATNVSRVAGLGYLGMLAGPAVIGALTHVVPLNVAFLLPLVFCAIAAVSAGTLRKGGPAGVARGHGTPAGVGEGYQPR
ncbi:MFS transporter [Symbioplanes lichenis]|uniref:MFS transporter n=1 Tax=Symbioplanes lichenis TaxID=1629072 RepID=UPI002738244A|nr:MFS transporter [Actinoplanes lichenis]